MSNTDKLLVICIFLTIAGLVLAAYDIQRHAYNKGVRDGYHRGRSIKGQE